MIHDNIGSIEQRLNIVLEAQRTVVGIVRERNLTVGVDQELVEVPLDVKASHDGRADSRGAHEVPGRVRVNLAFIVVDLSLLDDGESDAVLRLELDDVISAARLLVQELVARVSDDLETVLLVVGIDLN